ncbi:MAG: MBL fold metallo-hydrolase, partial [Pseudomonadota bacterium]
HAHFDHSGGLRTYVDAGATIVTMPINQAYYERIWKNPHTINPDRLTLSKKKPKFLPITNGKVELKDSLRNVEIYHQVGTAHNDGMAIVYLPSEKILIQVDAWNTEALTAPKPAHRNPYMVNLNDNIQRLKLDVALIVPLHGPRTGKMDELGELNKLPE